MSDPTLAAKNKTRQIAFEHFGDCVITMRTELMGVPKLLSPKIIQFPSINKSTGKCLVRGNHTIFFIEKRVEVFFPDFDNNNSGKKILNRLIPIGMQTRFI